MAMSEKLKNITKEDWRMLGFHYERDDENKKWIFTGSKNGLQQFSIYLEKYANELKNNKFGEHDHIGPYSYLKLMTNNTSKITKDYICGNLNNIKELSKLINKKIKESNIKDIFKIDKDFCIGCDYYLEFNVMEYGYDPAIADKQLWSKG